MSEEKCVICLVNLGQDSVRVALPSCGTHLFHSGCFSRWTGAVRDQRRVDRRSYLCPVCRGVGRRTLRVSPQSQNSPVGPSSQNSRLEQAVDAALDALPLSYRQAVPANVIGAVLQAGLETVIPQDAPVVVRRNAVDHASSAAGPFGPGLAGDPGTPHALTCQICHMPFRSRSAKSRHVETHNPPWICPICGKTINRPTNKHRHQASHVTLDDMN